MKNLLNNSLCPIKPETYLTLLIFLAPLLNFLSGITFDLYTPSMPALADYYSASMTAIKNTVTVTLIGYAIGCLIAGVLLDTFGRRRIILLALLSYAIVSLIAMFCQSIEQLMIVRCLQGLLVANVSVGCRAIIVDSFTGHRYIIALLYASLAYGFGPIVGPFIGGILQYHFGWKMNFFAYALFGMILFLIFAVYVNETIPARQTFSLNRLLKNYVIILKHPIFTATILIGGFCNIQLFTYSTIGSFIVENTLQRSAILYGNTALLVGCCYLAGVLTNRFFVKKFHSHHLTHTGFCLIILGVIIQLSFAWLSTLNLFTLIFPIMIVCYSQGFIFPNILGRSLKIFPNQAGVATSILYCLVISISGLGIFAMNHINVDNLANLAYIFLFLLIVQLIVFYGTGLSRLEKHV